MHVISHGGPGHLQLGSSVVDAVALREAADGFEVWRRALTEDADLLVYGCDVAAGDGGRAFIDALSQLTGADVAASDDLTGSAALGGDWQLEYVTGGIQSSSVIAAAVQQAIGRGCSRCTVGNTTSS